MKSLEQKTSGKPIKIRSLSDSEILSMALSFSLLVYGGCRHYQEVREKPKIPDFNYEENEQFIKDLHRINQNMRYKI